MNEDDVRDALREALDSEQTARVDDWPVETGPDATDDAAVWVWVILPEDELTSDNRGRLRNEVREAVQSRAGDQPVLVYVYFRSEAEQRELAKA